MENEKKNPTREEMLRYIKPDMTFDEMYYELGQRFGMSKGEAMCLAFKEKVSPLDVMSETQRKLYFLERDASMSSEYKFKEIIELLKIMDQRINKLEKNKE